MHDDRAHSPAPTTVVSSGGAEELGPAVSCLFRGGSLRVSHVGIADHISYAQHTDQPLLHATLRGGAGRSSGRIGHGDWVDGADRRGSVSVTPGGWGRRATVGAGEIVGAQIGFDAGFVEEACEQSLGAGWRGVFNGRDAKTFALAEGLVAAASGGVRDGLAIDVLALALARRLGRTYAGADRRRDDGWLHPAALARIVAQLRDAPAERPSLDGLARMAGLGVSAFARAFRGATGATPAAFAARVRLDHAADLLRATDLPVGEIAAASGFASASHLVRAFRAQRGVTPGRWRREIGRLAAEA